MRHEFDEEADLRITIFSDEPIVGSGEFSDGPIRQVHHFDANNHVVRMELYGYSKLGEREAQMVRRDFAADAIRREVVGDLDWCITDTATGGILAEARTDLLLSGFSIRTIQGPSKTLATKQVALTDEFTFGIATSLAPTPEIGGFALQGDRTDVHTFCWDWFYFDAAEHATKLQESGELQVRISNPNSQWQIVRTEFLTDVSIRVSRFGDESPLKPSWRILIRKGSWVNWPSLVNEAVVP